MSELFRALLAKRGVSEDFLLPVYDDVAAAEKLPDIDQAVQRIRQAVQKQEKVLVYGDYDVDGITASTLMYDTLKLVGVTTVEIMLPNRFEDGYGMNTKVVKRAKAWGFGLVVTVDCGSNDAEVVAALQEQGVDCIVTDHHECLGELPAAVAVVNPKRNDCVERRLSDLAGVGVAFMLARALVRAGLIRAGQEKWLLDLVVIGTICDNMAVNGINRALCYWGMRVLSKTRRVGLKELMKGAGVKKLNAEAVGFQLGPRLNAAGRMQDAELGLKVLMAQQRSDAARLVEQLNELNQQRKAAEREALKEIKERGIGDEPVIVVAGAWQEGILGIIAGRLLEEYQRPVFVLTEAKGIYKGSGRSFGDFNLAKALVECEEYLVSGGGHAAACGLKVQPAQLAAFRARLNDYYKSLKLTDQKRFLEKQADMVVDGLGTFSLELVEELGQLEPYGLGNTEPVWLVQNVLIWEAARMGEEAKHLRLLVRDKMGKQLKLVSFFAPGAWLKVEEGERVDVWLKLVENEWNGLRSVEGRIVKMRLAEEVAT